MRPLYAALIIGLLVLGACGDDEAPLSTGDDGTSAPDDTPPVGGSDEPTEYLSVSVTEDGRPRQLVDDTRISLRLGPDTVGASLGCNSMGGDHRLDGDTLVVDELAMTEMGCPPDLMEQDRWFAELLRSRPTLTIEDDTLVLASSNTAVTFRERSVVDPDRPLEGPEWVVTGFIEGDVATSFDPGPGRTPGTLNLDESTSTATGSDGCNAFSVPYEVDGDQLRFGQLSGETGGCEGSDEYERRFRAVLEGTVEWEITADRLTITAPDGRAVTYRAAE